MITFPMASYGSTLVDTAQARSLRETIQCHMSRGSDVALDWAGVAATNEYIVELLTGLEGWTCPGPTRLVVLSNRNMSVPVGRKIAMHLLDANPDGLMSVSATTAPQT